MTVTTDAQTRTNAASATVIVPTFNEAENVAPLVQELRSVLVESDRAWEILFVDDSDDHTPSEIRAAAAGPGVPVRLLHRAPDERAGGLGGAVLAGMCQSSADLVVVMDGDLQHPPETVPALIGALESGAADLAVASRYAGTGSANGLESRSRRLVSAGSTLLAKMVFPRRLRGCSDPMTGFFALRASVVDAESLQPMGFKILLEIVARHQLSLVEVPFRFRERHAGSSKAGLAQGMTYLWQLLNLRLGRAGRFATVGAVGVLVNLAVMAGLLGFGVLYLFASLIAAEVSMLANFVLQERLVFADVAEQGGRGRRLVQTLGINNLEALLRLPLLALLVERAAFSELVGQAVLLLAGFSLRFLVINRFVYPRQLVAKAGGLVSPSSNSGPVPPVGPEIPRQLRRGSSTRPTADLDIVIPALNEELRLGGTLEAIHRATADAPFRSRVIVVDNGSTDGTVDLAHSMSDRLHLDVVSCPTRGKGAAVRHGVLSSTGRYVAYCDADLSTPPDALLDGMELAGAGSLAVIGSRHVPGAQIERSQPIIRRLGGRAFNHVAVRLVGAMPDTQCGFKLLDGALARELFSEMKINGYAFDVELIARLQRRQIPFTQLPVRWTDDPATRFRIAVDGYEAFRDLLAVRRAVSSKTLARSRG